MKRISVKTTSFSIAAVGVAFIAGMVITVHPAPTPTPTHLYRATADVTQTTPDTTSTTQTTITPESTATTNTTTPGTSAPATSPAPQTAQSTSSPTSSQVTAVTVTSAALSDWQDGNDGSVFVGGPNNGRSNTLQQETCTYTYSDGSHQSVASQSRRLWNDGTITDVTNIGPTCDVNNAPAAN